MYIKPTSNFKLSKQTKRTMCTYADDRDRNSFKRDMIQAELAAEQRPQRRERPTAAGQREQPDDLT
jgi:hypothetical protein